MKLLRYLFLVVPLSAFAQHAITVEVRGLESSDGYVIVGLYNSEETWLEDRKMFKGDFTEITNGKAVVRFSDVPDGNYAISLFHDENGDKELTKNFFGIPKEPLGFSIGKLKTFGPPSFEECVFAVKRDFEIKIPVN